LQKQALERVDNHFSRSLASVFAGTSHYCDRREMLEEVSSQNPFVNAGVLFSQKKE
jgi:hypothetical protein